MHRPPDSRVLDRSVPLQGCKYRMPDSCSSLVPVQELAATGRRFCVAGTRIEEDEKRRKVGAERRMKTDIRRSIFCIMNHDRIRRL
jgi:hypothetical protein